MSLRAFVAKQSPHKLEYFINEDATRLRRDERSPALAVAARVATTCNGDASWLQADALETICFYQRRSAFVCVQNKIRGS
jgi:hypothetical protein